MSKTNWNTLHIQQLPPALLRELIDLSYDLVVAKFTKKLKAALDALD
jgi:predicted DNA-binding protein (MmcQ/YjbR family)